MYEGGVPLRGDAAFARIRSDPTLTPMVGCRGRPYFRRVGSAFSFGIALPPDPTTSRSPSG